MRETDDIAPLVGIVEGEFNRLHDEACASLHRLATFWTKLYGPNEALSDALEELGSLWDTFHEHGPEPDGYRLDGGAIRSTSR